MKYDKYIEKARSDHMMQVVITTASLLLEQSIDSLKMTDIASCCEVGVASLYRYFGTKTNIVVRAGCVLWEDVRTLFDGVFECDFYQRKTGIEQLRELMKIFRVLYTSHKDFLRFVDDFDRYIISETPDRELLHEYESSVLNFYLLFESAYKKGCDDGTVREDIDFHTLYLSLTHALLLMCEKFVRGAVLDSDEQDGAAEIDLVIEMGVRYISAQKGGAV